MISFLFRRILALLINNIKKFNKAFHAVQPETNEYHIDPKACQIMIIKMVFPIFSFAGRCNSGGESGI